LAGHLQKSIYINLILNK